MCRVHPLARRDAPGRVLRRLSLSREREPAARRGRQLRPDPAPAPDASPGAGRRARPARRSRERRAGVRSASLQRGPLAVHRGGGVRPLRGAVRPARRARRHAALHDLAVLRPLRRARHDRRRNGRGVGTVRRPLDACAHVTPIRAVCSLRGRARCRDGDEIQQRAPPPRAPRRGARGDSGGIVHATMATLRGTRGRSGDRRGFFPRRGGARAVARPRLRRVARARGGPPGRERRRRRVAGRIVARLCSHAADDGVSPCRRARGRRHGTRALATGAARRPLLVLASPDRRQHRPVRRPHRGALPAAGAAAVLLLRAPRRRAAGPVRSRAARPARGRLDRERRRAGVERPGSGLPPRRTAAGGGLRRGVTPPRRPALDPRAATHAVGAGAGPRPAGRVLEHVPLRAARGRVLRRPAAARPAAPQRTAERRHAAARRAGRRRRCGAPPERRQLLYLEVSDGAASGAARGLEHPAARLPRHAGQPRATRGRRRRVAAGRA